MRILGRSHFSGHVGVAHVSVDLVQCLEAAVTRGVRARLPLRSARLPRRFAISLASSLGWASAQLGPPGCVVRAVAGRVEGTFEAGVGRSVGGAADGQRRALECERREIRGCACGNSWGGGRIRVSSRVGVVGLLPAAGIGWVVSSGGQLRRSLRCVGSAHKRVEPPEFAPIWPNCLDPPSRRTMRSLRPSLDWFRPNSGRCDQHRAAFDERWSNRRDSGRDRFGGWC